MQLSLCSSRSLVAVLLAFQVGFFLVSFLNFRAGFICFLITFTGETTNYALQKIRAHKTCALAQSFYLVLIHFREERDLIR